MSLPYAQKWDAGNSYKKGALIATATAGLSSASPYSRIRGKRPHSLGHMGLAIADRSWGGCGATKPFQKLEMTAVSSLDHSTWNALGGKSKILCKGARAAILPRNS